MYQDSVTDLRQSSPVGGGSEEPARRPRKLGRPSMTLIRVGRVEEPRSDWRRAVAAVSERRVAEGRALYTQRSPAELYRGARSSERERYARQASRLGAQRPSTSPASSVITCRIC